MKGNFQPSYALVRKSEGGNNDDPDDHGGRTSRGVTQTEYEAWCKERGLPLTDVYDAPEESIAAIYREEYWQPFCDLMPIGVDYLYFDFAINTGPYQAAKTLQRALGVVADGRIGPITRQAIATVNATALTSRFTEKKKEFYRSLHQPKYLQGWLNRCDFVKTNALRMINERRD